MTTKHREFVASLAEAVRVELERFGLEMWMKFSHPVDTEVSTVVWATFEVPVLSQLEENVALVAPAALNRRFPYLTATAAEDMVTFVGREQFYVGVAYQEGVRRLVRRALFAYEAAQNVATLVVEGLWDGAKGAEPAGATREELWRWALDESALGQGVGDVEEAGPVVTRMLEGLGLEALGPRWGVDAATKGVYESVGAWRGARLGEQVLVRVDLRGDRDRAAGGVRVDVGGAPVAATRRTFLAVNALNLHAMLKDQPPAGAGC